MRTAIQLRVGGAGDERDEECGMELAPSADQKTIVDVAAQVIAKQAPITVLRANRDRETAFEAKSWKEFAELGWFGLGLPADVGGADLSLADEALLFVEIGRGLVPGPVLGATIGAHTAVNAGDNELASSIVAGDVLVGIGNPRCSEPWDEHGNLTGPIDLIDAAGCELVAVVVADRATLVSLEDLSEVQARTCIDPGSRLSSATANSVAPKVSVARGKAPIHDRALVLAAALAVGISEAARDMSVRYAKDRVQFGRPIGVNQAIKHACSDMAVRSHAAQSQLYFAAASFASKRADVTFQATTAKVVAVDAALANAAANIQVHGGMGYTDESDAHLYVKRARVVEHLFGSMRENLTAILSLHAVD
jgi:hypothetical protein